MERDGFAYRPAGPVAEQFHLSKAFFRLLRGPIGSGKTVACCYELWHMAQQQKPSPRDGWRRTRWAVVRNTYRQLETSTIKTWLKEFPETIFGKFRRSPPFLHLIQDPISKFEMEVYFLALDNEDNIRDLLSTEWTGMFLNEAREFPKGLVDNMVSRVRRYPSMKDGGATRAGLIADTNAPAEDHWWPIMAGDAPPPEHWDETTRRLYVKPRSWAFFSQPPALLEVKKNGILVNYKVNPKAENLKNLDPEYYSEQWQGKEKDWIDVYLRNQYKAVRAGKPIYPDFNQDIHVAPQIIEYDPNIETFLGMDFGLTPAAVLMMRYSTGQYAIVKEWVTTDSTVDKFAEFLSKELTKLGVVDYSGWGDPSGDNRDQQGQTAFNLMASEGIRLSMAPTNDPNLRWTAVTRPLTRMISGAPGLIVSPNCSYVVNGFVHGYRFRKKRVVGEVYEEKADKNIYSHVHDALQYAMLGAGEAYKQLGAKEGAKAVTLDRSKRDYVPGGRHGVRGGRIQSRFQ